MLYSVSKLFISQGPYMTEQTQQQVDPQNQIQVDIEYLRTTRVHICMPCYGGMLTEQVFMSFIKWSNTCRQLGIDWTLETMTNESLISRARNTLVAKFLNNPDSTHLFFVDADIGWEPWQLLVLLNHQKDVVGGLYPMKTLPIKWVVNGVEGGETEADGNLLEVSKTGTGFMLIKRDVFDKVKEHKDTIPFNNDIGLDPALDKNMYTFFDTIVREGRYYSEDWDFCEKFRDLGGKIWVDKRVLLRHTGTFVFNHEIQDRLYLELDKLAKENAANQANAEAVEPAPDAPVDPEIVAEDKSSTDEA